MYYDPLLHPENPPRSGSTLSRVVLISAVVSGTLCLYVLVTVIS
jgi:hypothetical protein